jgi:16S rRNA (uracil1498-N3)-methyltransferase
MRSIFYSDINIENISTLKTVTVTGDSARHLIKVVRIKINEEVLLLNGKGLKVFTKVKVLEKKEVLLDINNYSEEGPKHRIDLALALPKKEAVEDIVRFAIELGINNIIPMTSKYSQSEIKRNERLDRIIEGAMIQSNNPYILNIAHNKNLTDLKEISESYDKVIFFCSQKRVTNKFETNNNEKLLIVIGPEAGLTTEEEEGIAALENSYAVHMNSYILRAPTALCTATGFVLSKID